jgi:hypothetical protein
LIHVTLITNLHFIVTYKYYWSYMIW